MRKIFVLSLVLTAFLSARGQMQFVPVFTAGAEGYKSYRIPAIIVLPGGDLLAFAEGRVYGSADFGDVDIVMKRSSDKGKTWGPLQLVAEFDSLQAGNPAPAVDLTDPQYPKGRIFLFYNTGNNHESEVRKGLGYKQVWYKTSADGGRTWSTATDITLQVHRPRQPNINPAYNFPDDWRTYANTPGHAMQFQSGKYKGRIFIAANHSAGGPQQQSTDYDAHGFYTDDHGKSFQLGASLERPGSNESMAAEISGGRLMLNSRNQKGDIRARIIGISKDGGQTWDSTYFEHSLPDPVCQGSILTLEHKKGKNILAFCNAAHAQRRDNLTLRISNDDAKTWKKSFLIYKNPEKRDASAYSDIVKTGRKTIGVLFEKDGYSQIVFVTVVWK